MDTNPVFDWKTSTLGAMPVFHLVSCVHGKFPCCVIVDDVIDGLMGHLYPLIPAQITRYLSWRPLVIGDIFFNPPDQFLGESGVRYSSLPARIAVSCAFVQIYFPDGVLLRLISRESVA